MITPHSICVESLLVPALDNCFWHNIPQSYSWNLGNSEIVFLQYEEANIR